MIKQLDFYGYPYVGIYASNTENYLVVPPDLPEESAQKAADALGVEIIATLMNDSTLVGSMMTGNSNGFLVSGLAMDSEVAKLEQKLPVVRMTGKMTAAGNIILVNDTAALVHPALSDKNVEAITKTLKVDVKRGTIGGLKTVGMAGVATNKRIARTPQGHGGGISRT